MQRISEIRVLILVIKERVIPISAGGGGNHLYVLILVIKERVIPQPMWGIIYLICLNPSHKGKGDSILKRIY